MKYILLLVSTLWLAVLPQAVWAQSGNVTFNQSNIIRYSPGTGEYGGDVTVEDSGATLHLKGDLSRAIPLSYQVTANTILEFDFKSANQGAVHGIGLDPDLQDTRGPGIYQSFIVYGTEERGIRGELPLVYEFEDYSAASTYQHYRIPVGNFYRGQMSYLFFLTIDKPYNNDGLVNGESYFSNVRVYEGEVALPEFVIDSKQKFYDATHPRYRQKVWPGTTFKLAGREYIGQDDADTGNWYTGDLQGTAQLPITITAQDPNNPPRLINHNAFNIQNNSYVTLSHFVFKGSTGDGAIRISENDDSKASSNELSDSHHITVEYCIVLNSGNGGNKDAMKISHTDYSTIRNVWIEGWVDDSCAIDHVACQHNLVENSVFIGSYTEIPAGTPADREIRYLRGGNNGVMAKGGSRDVLVRNNFFLNAGQHPVIVGGHRSSIGAFRDPPGTVLADGTVLDYEGKDVEVVGNRIVTNIYRSGDAGVAWKVSSGGNIHHNTIVAPVKDGGQQGVIMRILGYYPADHEWAPLFAPVHDGSFHHNLVVYNYGTLGEWGQTFLQDYPPGPADEGHTAEDTFSFSSNAWFDLVSPATSPRPEWPHRDGLPTPETDGIYQVNPTLSDIDPSTGRLVPLMRPLLPKDVRPPALLRIQSDDSRFDGIGADAYTLDPNDQTAPAAPGSLRISG